MTRQVLDDFRVRFTKAFAAGDAAAVAAFYTKDGKILPPNMPMITGPQEIQGFFKGARDMGMRGITLDALEVEISGDLAYEVGKYSIDMELEGGQTMTDVGKYLMVLKRQADGSWMMSADMFSSDAPAPGP